MYIPLDELVQRHQLKIRGVLHIGAHFCEEADAYKKAGVKTVTWIEADASLVAKGQAAGHEVIEALVSDTDGDEVDFHIMNFTPSSSMLPLNTHAQHFPDIHVVRTIQLKTKRLETLANETKGWDWSNYNFLNMDIQGAELKALKGMSSQLHHFDAIYTEVNQEELYKGCALIGDIDAFLGSHGFYRAETKLVPQRFGDALYLKRSTQAVAKDSKHHLIFGSLGDRGRLGNQLFQVAATHLLATAVNRSPSFSGTKWPYEQFFASKIAPSVVSPDDQPKKPMLLEEASPHTQISLKKLEELKDEENIEIGHYFQHAGYFDNPLIAGYLTTKLFQPNAETEKRLVQRCNQLFGLHHQTWKEASTFLATNFVAVHVRRGDYTMYFPGAKGPICLPWSYFSDAMKYIQSQNNTYSNYRFLIFSDDVGFVKTQICGIEMEERFKKSTVVVITPPKVDLDDILLMAACGGQIISNSSYSWWAAYLNGWPHNKKTVVAPKPWFNHVGNSNNILLKHWKTIDRLDQNSTEFQKWVLPNPGGVLAPPKKDELKKDGLESKDVKDVKDPLWFNHPPVHLRGTTARLWPLPYAIPNEHMIPVDSTLIKRHVLADLIPGNPLTYRFGPGEEALYYQTYTDARFALTKPKSGYDALRHYEILAAGGIPLFENLALIPKNTMISYPKALVQQAMNDCLPWKQAGMQKRKQLYQEHLDALLRYTHENLGTDTLARYFLSREPIKALRPKNILMFMCDPGVNYSREMLLIGLRRSNGLTVVDYPKLGHNYKDSGTDLGACYGHGFTYGGVLVDDPLINRAPQHIQKQIESHAFDLIIYGKIGVFDGAQGSIGPELPFWSQVAKHYTNKEIVFVYGGDAAANDSNPRFKEHLQKHSDAGICFVRELI